MLSSTAPYRSMQAPIPFKHLRPTSSPQYSYRPLRDDLYFDGGSHPVLVDSLVDAATVAEATLEAFQQRR